ncbi:MAG TPA: ABC transporter ATP-binding protein [Rubrivivax sp.]|nr:ABC transporter ATP-binding protein [Burkholderiales bacterium]HNU09920.1 ABC transporter ATP-binding protein [Rubrivivax sp.]
MTQPILEVQGLGSRYGRVPALTDVSLEVRPGELVAIVGANGAGKTTLMRSISGVQPATARTLRFDGQDIGRASARKRVQMGIVQVPEGRQLFPALSVEDNLLLGTFARGTRARLDEICAMFPILVQKRNDPAGTLSGGQQQMLALGRALMTEPKLLLLDEPSMGLAPRLVAEVFQHVAALKARGTTIVLADQNARAALAIADRGYVMETGHIVHTGPAAELLHDEKVRQAYLGM